VPELGAERRPYRLLDLACGAGAVRVATARRLPQRTVEYVGIDPSRSRLQGVADILRELARAHGPAALDGAEAVDPAALAARLRERFVRAELDLNTPVALADQLARIVPGERFDEIHMHLLHPGKHGAQAVGPRVMRTLARYLRPGGRIYHLFQRSSPLFTFEPKRIASLARDATPPRVRHQALLDDEERRFRTGARRGGLLLEKCGHLWTKGRVQNADGTWGTSPRAWITRPAASLDTPSRPEEIVLHAVERHSLFSAYATHFVILRRRRLDERAAGRRRRTVARD